MPTPPSLITKSQFSPSSIDRIIPFWLVAMSTPFDSTNFITQPPLWDLFPGLSTIRGFKKAIVGADENNAFVRFKNGAYLLPMKISVHRRPYTRSV